MMKVQRRWGRMLPRSADESQVSVVLKDYEDADQMLLKIIDSSKAWRDAWVSILGTQTQLVGEYTTLYAPIIGAGETHDGPEYASTPPETIERAVKLKQTYEDLRKDLLEELNMVDSRIIKPAMDARDYIQPMKKVIKKREDKKLDFERYRSRVDSLEKKMKRSDRENASLAKSKIDLERATDEYNVADDHLRSSLPPIIAASFSMLPHLLSNQILIQNTLLAQLYTSLNNYCEDENFLPAEHDNPDIMSGIIADFEALFRPIQHQLETTINPIATGKAVKQPMHFEDQMRGSVTGLNIRNKAGQSIRGGSQKPPPARLPPSPSMAPALAIEAKPSRPEPSRSYSSNHLSPAAYENESTATPSEYGTPGTGGAHSPAAPRTDYFSRDRVPSTTSLASSVANIAAKKKPPPPPPPKKRSPSAQGLFVTALYSFQGQSAGDLAFQEGDKIRVVKKTDSTDDWWEGELKGARGSFPANYCQAG